MSWENMRARHGWLLTCLLVFAALPTVAADRGMIWPGGISVYEPGQKAIIAWDGENEVLILSTDVQADNDTWVLELLPLPSQPASPEAGSFDSFMEIQSILWSHTVQLYTDKGLALPDKNAVQVIFHENIGAHDITVVSATGVQAIIDFAKNLLENKGLTGEVSWGRLENLASAYLQRGMNYWVLDLVDLSNYLMSREPIIYTFKSNYLYFPLEISSLASGDTEISLFTITDNKLDASSVEATGFSIASFTAGEENIPIEFEVDESELQQISPRVAELFEDNTWLTALTYSGPLDNLRADIMFFAAVPPGEAEQPTGADDRLLAAAWAAAIVVLLLLIFAIVYKLSPHYKIGQS